VLHIAQSAEGEARWIARKIKEIAQHAGSGGAGTGSVAILFRTNFQSRALEEGLLREGVSYTLLGTRFFARKEVKDTLAWIRLAIDSSREADKVRAASAPPRGIGTVTLGKLAAGQRSLLRAGELAKVEAFERIVSELSAAADSLAPSDFVKLVVEKNGMKEALLEKGSEEDRERFENIEELASVAARHDVLVGREGVALFLAEAALASDQDELDHPSKRSGRQEGVMLMTVHAAKGLEFDTVFVSGMEEGLFPHSGMGGDAHRDEEEERRLFYVAMTRAKSRLFLTLASVRKVYGSDTYAEPSSFLADIDPALILYDETDATDII
jgi:DNA helicase-2/ATP-dependent DNA helicase PcrA